MKSTNSLARYTLLNDLDEALVAECLPPTMGGVVPAAVAEAIATEVAAANAEAVAAAQAAAGVVIDEVTRPGGLARFGLFLKSGLGIGLAAGIVAVGVIAAALIGNLMRGDTPGENPGGTTGGIPGVSGTVADSQSESDLGVTEEPEDTAEPGTTGEQDTSESGVTPLPGDARIAVCNGAGEILLPDVYPLWTEVWMPGQDGAPGSMASGSSEGMPPMAELLDTLKGLTIRYDAGLTFIAAENYRVTAMRLYDENGEFLYSVAEDEVATLDERTGGGVYYVELGLLYTGRYIEEAKEHEESFFEVPFCLLIGEETEETVPFENAVIHRKDDAFGAWYPPADREHHLVVIDSYDEYMAQEPREAVYDAAFFEDHVLLFIFYHGMNYGESEYVRELTDLYVLDGVLVSTLTVEYTEIVMEAEDMTYLTAEVRREDLPETETGEVEVDWVLIKGQA